MRVRLLPGSIGGLAIGAALLLALVTGLLGVLTYIVVHEEIERQIDHRIQNETRALLAYHREHGLAALANVVRIRDRVPSPLEAGYVRGADDTERTMGHIVTDAAGRRLVDTLGSKMPPPGWSEFLTFRTPDGRDGVAQVMNSPLAGGGRLVVAADRSVVDHMDLAILKLFLAAFAVILAMGALITLGLGRIVRRRLDAIEADAAAIMAGDISRRMALDGSGGEFDRLASALNRMLDRIGHLVVNLRQVSSDIAHDMRTPLTRLRRHLELAEHDGQNAVREHIAAAGEEADELLELFSDLLAISEVEGQSMRKGFVPVAWDDAVQEIVDAYRLAFADAGKALDLYTVPVTVRGNRRLLRQCVANLLDNALVHTPSGTTVAIHLAMAGDTALLTVSDDGPGVPPSDHERIFERLTRLDTSRAGTGHGLGLSMVMAISRAHFGNARVVPSNQGLTIEVALPQIAER